MVVVRIAVRIGFWGVVLATPVLGFWLASALVAYVNGPRWAVLLGGALLFPLGPVAWEAWATLRRRRSMARAREALGPVDRVRFDARGRRITTLPDRLLLRTLALNLPFLLALGAWAPELTLTAAATRGDWMLDGVAAPWADTARRWLVAAGDAAQRYNGQFEDNPYQDLAETRVDRVPAPEEVEPPTVAPVPEPALIVTVRLPPEVTAQVRQQLLQGDTAVELPPGEAVALSATFGDGRKLGCSWTAVAGGPPEVALAEADGKWALGGVPCEELRAPNPTWRPELRLETRRIGDWIAKTAAELRLADPDVAKVLGERGALEPGETLFRATDGSWVVLGPPVVAPDQVVAVHLATPYLRVELTAAGRDALCAATTGRGGYRFGAVVERELRFVHLIEEAQCTGFVPLELGTRAIQHDWPAGVVPEGGAAGIAWPPASEPHPLAATLADESIDRLGQQIAAQTDGDLEAARLVHDWIALHVAYDAESLLPGRRAPQDADTVFRTGKGVCAGYSNLFVALGRAAGLDPAYVTGNVRARDGDLAGSSHAWNAVKIDGKWALLDVTWDAGSLRDEDGRYEARYRTDYLFAPPAVFRGDHLPEHDAWQLHPTPLSRGEFIRQPMVTPSFHAAGLVLVAPDRPQVDARGSVEVQLRNEGRRSLIANLGGQSCGVVGEREVTVRCDLPAPGAYELDLFQAARGARRHEWVGRVRVNAR
ncbi:MAG: transglutaminase domain-containing protein [Myxococcota bacterium]